LDEEDANALDALGEILVGYGEKHFEGEGEAKKGLWSRALLMTGRFELAVAAMYGNANTQVEAVHLAIALAYYGLLNVPAKNEASEVDIGECSLPGFGNQFIGLKVTQTPGSRVSLNLGLLISRYIRHFVRSDPKEAVQYVYCLSLNEGLAETRGKEQTEFAWELTRRIIVSSEGTSSWDELVGGMRADGTRYVSGVSPHLRTSLNKPCQNGSIEHGLKLLNITSTKHYIKLYNLADAHTTVISCLARGLGEYISELGGGGADAKSLETLAREVLRHYDRENRANGKERDTVIQLLGIREAMDAREKGRLEAALEVSRL
jgi:nuclear pore complex protein Nup93